MRRIAVLAAIVFLLSGCKIFTVLDREDLGGSFFEPGDVEGLPDGSYLAVGCSADASWGGVGIVVTRPGGARERFFPGCGGPMNATVGPDGRVYFSWQRDPAFFDDPFFTIVALDTDTGASETVFTYDRLMAGVAYAPDGRLLFGARDTVPDANGRRPYRIHQVTGPNTSVPVAGTQELGLADFVVDDDGAIYAAGGAILEGRYGVYKVLADGTATRIAGTGEFGFSGDGGPALAATFGAIGDVDVNDAGEVFIADYGNNRIRFIDADGTVDTLAGGGENDTDDGILATQAALALPGAIAVDHDRQLWIADAGAMQVRYVGTNPPE
jgi:hypothetical protein